MNLILCGMPCSGKTYYGKLIANDLGTDFIDTDEQIMSLYFKDYQAQATCREIVLKKGEPFFRKLEKKVVKGLSEVNNAVIALGGGTLCDEENVFLLKSIGWLGYLNAPPHVILDRIRQKRDIPSMFDENRLEESFENLLRLRLPIYEKHCDFMIETDWLAPNRA